MIFDSNLHSQAQPSKLTTLQGYRKVDLRKFKLGTILGKGASGTVHKAMCSGYFFAVKKISLRDLAEGCKAAGNTQHLHNELDALKSEITLMKKLDHPRVVNYIGSLLHKIKLPEGKSEQECKEEAEANGTDPIRKDLCILIFMEYCPFGSMSGILKKFGPYELSLVRKYMRQVLEGLYFLHSRGIVHRDLKGANILIAGNGDAKISDLGAVKQLDGGFGVGNLGATMSGELAEIKGSVYWMAPETVQGIVGRRSDVWSSGCLCIEMLTALHPWHRHPLAEEWSGGNVAKAIQYIMTHPTEKPPFPQEADEQCIGFLNKCLDRDHKNRAYVEDLLRHEFILD